MTIGPLPSTRIFWMSSLRGNEIEEAVEEIDGVVRAGSRFGVVLRGRAGNVLQHKALDGAVVEIHVRQLGDAEVRLPAHRLVGLDALLAVRAEHSEAVVLRRDVDLPGLEVLDR